MTYEEPAKGHSEEIQEIITAPPKWLMKWGVGMFLVVISIFALLSVCIHYPDTVRAHLVLKSYARVKPVFAGDSGALIRLFIRNGQHVSKDQPLALIGDPEDQDGRRRYLVLAPDSGEITIPGFISENQKIAANQRLFFVVDDRTAGFYGLMAIPQSEITNIKKGQKVLIKISSYPYQKYGLLRGVIDIVDEAPYNDSIFFSKVSLIDTPTKRIMLKSGLTADVEIITRDVSLASRLLSRFRE
jgi:multidrug efflux pump subunit AcrA (membrane-fusion protein)